MNYEWVVQYIMYSPAAHRGLSLPMGWIGCPSQNTYVICMETHTLYTKNQAPLAAAGEHVTLSHDNNRLLWSGYTVRNVCNIYLGPIFSKAVLKCRWLLEHENLSKFSKCTGKFLNLISQISDSISKYLDFEQKNGSMCHLHFKMAFEKIGS